ncbi:hypothetical protein [uncultured Methylobacterium sp.]|uniref:DUF7940 domain-containing protein n=1 Tax=uncultured Methylobacterium sp. TaxID=157278 RepID=UPI0035C98F85
MIALSEIRARIRAFEVRKIENFDKVLKRAWSVRFLILATVIDGAQAGCGFFSGSDLVRPGTLTAINMSLMLAALGARLVAQEAVSGPALPGEA